MSTIFALATAGIWSFIWHWGLGIGVIILLIAAAVFSESIPIIGPQLHDIRKDLFWAAGAVALLLVGEYIGAADANKHNVAKQIVIEKTVSKAVSETTTPAAKKQKDKYDDPNN